jgi:phosphate transport system permease protein
MAGLDLRPARVAARRGLATGDGVFDAVLVLAVGLLFFSTAGVVGLVARDVALEPSALAATASLEWNPATGRFGLVGALVASVATALAALLLAGPAAIGAAVWVVELAPPRLRAPALGAIEFAASVPSVAYGLWGMTALAPFVAWLEVPGTLGGSGWLTAAIALGAMIAPTIAVVSVEVVARVPRALSEAAIALGATRAESVVRVVLPAARRGLFGASLLGLARALGEAVAIAWIVGGRVGLPREAFGPTSTLATLLLDELLDATGRLHLAALATAALALTALTMSVHVVARRALEPARIPETTLSRGSAE